MKMYILINKKILNYFQFSFLSKKLTTRLHQFVFAFLLLIALSTNLVAEETQVHFFNQLKDDTSTLFSSWKLYGVAGSGLLATQALNHYTDTNKTFKSYWDNSARNYFLQTGNVLQFQALFFAGASYLNSNRAKSFAYINSVALSSLISTSLKLAVNEKRPRGSGHGWPSGHTTAAVSALGVSLALKDPLLITLSFIGTGITAYSRLLYNKKNRAFHSLTQVLAGLILGTTTGYIIGKNISYKDKPSAKKSTDLIQFIRNDVHYLAYNYSIPN